MSQADIELIIRLELKSLMQDFMTYSSFLEDEDGLFEVMCLVFRYQTLHDLKSASPKKSSNPKNPFGHSNIFYAMEKLTNDL